MAAVRQHPLVVMIGAPGAGKTRTGKRVARLLRVPFIDTDRRIVLRHGPIAQVFAARGEEQFRKIERIEVARALTEYAVVSLGGGAILDEATRHELSGLRVALLTVSAEAVATRIGDKRPLLKQGGVEGWEKLVEGRRAIYESLATRTWDSSNRPIDSIAQEIADWIGTGNDEQSKDGQ
ncbi:MAG: shikimate kinase [Burkholderiaceae bacterium]|nr:shikimate kinase [Microbacteriaceae bacterium]